MLSLLLCGAGRSMVDDDDAFTFETPAPSSPPGRRKTLSSGSRKKTGAKLVIGAPTDFKHESHFGYDEMAGLNIDQYKREIELKIAAMSPATKVIQASFPAAIQRQASLPSHTYSHPQRPEYTHPDQLESERLSSPPSPTISKRSNTIKRKPVPSMLTDTSSSDIPSAQSSPGIPMS